MYFDHLSIEIDHMPLVKVAASLNGIELKSGVSIGIEGYPGTKKGSHLYFLLSSPLDILSG
jgi:hypothetical protein